MRIHSDHTINHWQAASMSERSEANNRGLFEIPRYLYMYMCVSVCTCIAQDRVHLSQVLARRPLCELSFRTLAAVRSTTLRSRSFARYGRRRQFSWRQPGRRQQFKPYVYSYQTQEHPDDDSDLGHTRTAIGHRKPSSSLTAAKRQEKLAAKRLQHIPFFITSSYYSYMYLSMHTI